MKKFETIGVAARRKLMLLDAAESLKDLLVPPGNCLEARKGTVKVNSAPVINDQYRICFTCKENGAHDVEIADYHT